MKAVQLHRYTEAPTVDEVAEPKIVGPWDVIVDVGAAGLCRTDLHIIEGQWDPSSTRASPISSVTRTRAGCGKSARP